MAGTTTQHIRATQFDMTAYLLSEIALFDHPDRAGKIDIVRHALAGLRSGSFPETLTASEVLTDLLREPFGEDQHKRAADVQRKEEIMLGLLTFKRDGGKLSDQLVDACVSVVKANCFPGNSLGQIGLQVLSGENGAVSLIQSILQNFRTPDDFLVTALNASRGLSSEGICRERADMLSRPYPRQIGPLIYTDAIEACQGTRDYGEQSALVHLALHHRRFDLYPRLSVLQVLDTDSVKDGVLQTKLAQIAGDRKASPSLRIEALRVADSSTQDPNILNAAAEIVKTELDPALVLAALRHLAKSPHEDDDNLVADFLAKYHRDDFLLRALEQIKGQSTEQVIDLIGKLSRSRDVDVQVRCAAVRHLAECATFQSLETLSDIILALEPASAAAVYYLSKRSGTLADDFKAKLVANLLNGESPIGDRFYHKFNPDSVLRRNFAAALLSSVEEIRSGEVRLALLELAHKLPGRFLEISSSDHTIMEEMMAAAILCQFSDLPPGQSSAETLGKFQKIRGLIINKLGASRGSEEDLHVAELLKVNPWYVRLAGGTIFKQGRLRDVPVEEGLKFLATSHTTLAVNALLDVFEHANSSVVGNYPANFDRHQIRINAAKYLNPGDPVQRRALERGSKSYSKTLREACRARLEESGYKTA